MVRHHQEMVLDLLDQTGGFEIREHLAARRETFEPAVAFGHRVVQMRVAVEDIDRFETMPAPHLVVVEIVRRGDLDRAAAHGRIGVFVGNDRDQPADERQPYRFADEVGVALILGMDRDAGVAEHCLGTGRCYDEETPALALDRVADVPQLALGFPALDFEVRDHRVHDRIPIDQALVAVDQPLPVEGDKHPAHRRREAAIHREALAAPIGGRPEAAQLPGDRAARLRLPLPDPLDELLAAEVVLVDLSLGELVGDDDLGGDPGVIGAGLPQCIAPAHPLEANEDVLQRKGQRMAHVQAAGHVRRRHHDRVGPLLARWIGGETAGALPRLVLASFHRAGAIGFVQHCRTVPQSTILPALPRGRSHRAGGRARAPKDKRGAPPSSLPGLAELGQPRSRMRAAQLGKSAAISKRNGAAILSARRRTPATCLLPLCNGGPCRRAAPAASIPARSGGRSPRPG